MNNQEKAREIELNVYVFGEKPKGEFQAPAYRAALEMAEWKDQQFKEYLEKKKDELRTLIKHSTGGSFPYVMYMTMVDKIINELFGETENVNHSNNDE